MSFATAICCIDGRIQLPVINHLRERFGVDYIDNITDAGPVGILAEHPDSSAANIIFRLIEISISSHESEGLAIVAHHDCAGNPIPDFDQQHQLGICINLLAERFPNLKVVGLWVDEKMNIIEFSGK